MIGGAGSGCCHVVVGGAGFEEAQMNFDPGDRAAGCAGRCAAFCGSVAGSVAAFAELAAAIAVRLLVRIWEEDCG